MSHLDLHDPVPNVECLIVIASIRTEEECRLFRCGRFGSGAGQRRRSGRPHRCNNDDLCHSDHRMVACRPDERHSRSFGQYVALTRHFVTVSLRWTHPIVTVQHRKVIHA